MFKLFFLICAENSKIIFHFFFKLYQFDQKIQNYFLNSFKVHRPSFRWCKVSMACPLFNSRLFWNIKIKWIQKFEKKTFFWLTSKCFPLLRHVPSLLHKCPKFNNLEFILEKNDYHNLIFFNIIHFPSFLNKNYPNYFLK